MNEKVRYAPTLWRDAVYGGCDWFCERCGALIEAEDYPPGETPSSAKREGTYRITRYPHKEWCGEEGA